MTGKSTLDETAEDFYEEHRTKRVGAVEIGKRIAEITIPSVFPHEEYKPGQDELPFTNQSINSFLINSISNTLALTALPPGLPMCKLEPDETALADDIKSKPELWTETVYALSRREEVHRTRLERTNARDAYQRTMRLLMVTGNCLCVWVEINRPKVYNMHNYVVRRAADGEPLVTVLRETVSLAIVDDDIREAVLAHRKDGGTVSEDDDKKPDYDDEAVIYHVQTLELVGPKKRWYYWQETEGGYFIDGTDYYQDYETPVMWPAHLSLDTGADWALPYAYDYEGDLKAVEELSAGFLDGSAAIAQFLRLVDPTGITDIRKVTKARNLDTIPGRAEDVTVPTANKNGELQTVANGIESVSRRLGMAFASEASIQRSGERVTAEEWKRMSMALDKSMGGVYSSISQTIQRWFILRFLYLHQKENKKLVPLPKDLVSIGVITGLDGIGRSSEYENLTGLCKDYAEIMGPEGLREAVEGPDLFRRMAASRAIKTDGLVITAEKRQAAQEAQMARQQQQAMIEKGTGPLAKGGADLINQMMQQQQQQGSPNGTEGQ